MKTQWLLLTSEDQVLNSVIGNYFASFLQLLNF